MVEQCTNALLIDDNRDEALRIQELLSEYEGIDGCRINLIRFETVSAAVNYLAVTSVDAVLVCDRTADSASNPPDDLPGVAGDAPILLLHSGTHSTAVGRALHLGAANCLPKYELNSLLLGRSLVHAVESRRLQSQIGHNLSRDAVTGLPNRDAFVAHLETALERERTESGYGFAVFFLDLDHFKKINDSLGHESGDELLVEITQRLDECVADADVLSRFGGDEFTILLDNVTDVEGAIEAADRIANALSSPVTLHQHQTVNSASIGIVMSSMGYESPGEILRDAEFAMYRAKDKGRSDYTIFDETMRDSAIERLSLEKELRIAVADGDFRLVYQPIVELKTGCIVGFETLIRWHHAERGFISPATFIPIAEETGLIVPIGRWVLQEACTQMQNWKQEFPELGALGLSVNLSSRELTQTDLIDHIDQALDDSGFAANCLDLEITETAIIENDETVAAVFSQIKDRGIRLSIDDFGMGYSSLSYLHRFAFDRLKIDRSFVNRLGDGEEDSDVFVQTIVTLASTLGLQVIAEGVETEAQKQRVTELDCDFGQGYLFAKPIDRRSMPSVLSAEAALYMSTSSRDGRLMNSSSTS